jgi:hypothetical protein
MNKVLKGLFEIIIKTVATIVWSCEHPKDALVFIWKSKNFGSYISAFILTGIALVFALSHEVLRIHSNLVVYGFALGMFLLLSTVLKCLPNDDEDRGRVPLRKETKVLYSILLPVGLLVPVVSFIAYRFPAPMSRVFPPVDETIFQWLKPIVHFIGQFPVIYPVLIVAVIIVIRWSILNYRGYNK